MLSPAQRIFAVLVCVSSAAFSAPSTFPPEPCMPAQGTPCTGIGTCPSLADRKAFCNASAPSGCISTGDPTCTSAPGCAVAVICDWIVGEQEPCEGDCD
jgi:hypothetical protein